MMASYPEQQLTETAPASTGAGNVARLVDRLSKDISSLQKVVPIKPPKPNNNNSRTAEVRFSYLAQHDDELTLEESDVIEVIEDVEDGWARGKLKDKVGLFPTNFVSFTATPATNTTSYTALSRVNEEPRNKAKDEQSITPPSSNGNGKPLSDKAPTSIASTGYSNNVMPSTFKASVRKNGASTANNNTTPTYTGSSNKSVKEYAKVLYEYKALNLDELDLKEGDIVTVTNRKCTDEGWCEGELNGRRGLFPENFVKITSNSATPMSTSGSNATTPPVLPAKPLKPVGFSANKPETTSVPSTTTSSVSTSNTQSIQINQNSQASSNSSPESTPPPSNVNTHKPLEERKSVVAGIQSRLFPQGKMPPHKPTFQPPSNAFTSSQHPTSRSNDSDFIPTVQMRHSVVDPTKMNMSASHFKEQSLVDENGESLKLESLTKFRPKQSGKRPPSTQFRTSHVVVKPESPPITPPLTPTSNAPNLNEPIVLTTGPSTTSFPAESRSPQSSPNSTITRAQEVQSAVKELNSIATTVNNASVTKQIPSTANTMGQKPSSRHHSSGSTHSNFYSPSTLPEAEKQSNEPMISRAEFNDFRSEVLKRLAKLEERILKLDHGTHGTTEAGQQHF